MGRSDPAALGRVVAPAPPRAVPLRPAAERTRVLLVAENGEAGGIGRYCVDLAGVIGPLGEAQVVCLCPAPCGGRCWLAHECERRAVALHRVAMPSRAWAQGLTGLLHVWRSSGRPLIHVNGRRGNSVAFAARLAARGFRFVTTVHGVLGLHNRRNLIYRLIDLAAGRAARAVIAVSEDTRQRVIAGGSPAGRTFAIGNGLAASDLKGLRLAAATRAGSTLPNKLRIGFLGRLSPEKGTAELVKIAGALSAADAKTVLAVAGDGPDRDWMMRVMEASGDRERIRWYGTISNVPSFLLDVDVLVMPSHNEGSPYALLESMAAGCAIVAFAVGGIPEVVTDSSLGVIVAPRDVDAMVGALLDLADHPEKARQIGETASQHVAMHHALAERVPDIKHAYGWTMRDSAARPVGDPR